MLFVQVALSFVGAFVSLLVIAAINIAMGNRYSLPLLLAPFGASATLLYVRFASLRIAYSLLAQDQDLTLCWRICLTLSSLCRVWLHSLLRNLAMSLLECCSPAWQASSRVHCLVHTSLPEPH